MVASAGAHHALPPVIPALRGLDQESAGVGGAGLGDRPEPALLAGGVLAGHDPEVGGELIGVDRYRRVGYEPRSACG